MKTCLLVLLFLVFANSQLFTAPAKKVTSDDVIESGKSASGSAEDDADLDDEFDKKTPAFYRGVAVTIKVKEHRVKEKDPETSNLLYRFEAVLPGGEDLAPILNAIPGKEFKGLFAEMVIRFNAGRAPRQLTSECQIGMAIGLGDITVTPGEEVFKCDLAKGKGPEILVQPQPPTNKKSKKSRKSKKSAKEIVIVTQPETQTLVCDTNAVFAVEVEGKGPFTYQWRLCDQDIPGATDSILIISDADPAALGDYSVVVANKNHFVISDSASLLPEPVPPLTVTDLQTNNLVLLCWPQSCSKFLLEQSLDGAVWTPVELPVGTFEADNCVTVTQTPAPQATQSRSLQSVPAPARQFRLVSSELLAPKILLQPASQTNAVGALIHLSVLVSGSPPLQYQWRLNGSDLPNATGAILDIPSAQLKDFGTYEVVVLNGVEAILSQAARVVPGDLPGGLTDPISPADGTTNMAANGTILGFNIGFTKEPGEPNHDGRLGGSSAWFAWKPPANGIVTFDTRGSSFDTVLAAYTLDSLGRFVPEGSDDDNGGFKTSLIRFNASTDRTYHIAVDGVRRGDESTNASDGSIVLSWDLEETTDRLPRIVMQPIDVVVGMSNTVVSIDGGGEIGLLGVKAGLGGSTTNAFVPSLGQVFLNVLAEVPDCPTCPALSYRWRRDGVDLNDDANVQQTGGPGLSIFPTDFSSPFFPQPILPFLAGNYSVVIANGNRTIESRAAILQFATDPTVVFSDKLDEAYIPPTNPPPIILGIGTGSEGTSPTKSLKAPTGAPRPQVFAPLSSGTIIANPVSFRNSSPIGVKLDCRTNGFTPMFVTNFVARGLTGPAGSNFLYLDTFGSVDTNGVSLDTLSVNYRVVTMPPVACNNDAEGSGPWSFVRFGVTNLLSYRAVVYASTNSPRNSFVQLNYTFGKDTPSNATAAASSRAPVRVIRRSSKLEE